MLRIFGLRIFFGLAAGMTRAAAAETTIGNVTITLPSPPGFCELSAGQPADSRIMMIIGGVVAQGGNKLLNMSADCQQLPPGAPAGGLSWTTMDNTKRQSINWIKWWPRPKRSSVRPAQPCARKATPSRRTPRRT